MQLKKYFCDNWLNRVFKITFVYLYDMQVPGLLFKNWNKDSHLKITEFIANICLGRVLSVEQSLCLFCQGKLAQFRTRGQ